MYYLKNFLYPNYKLVYLGYMKLKCVHLVIRDGKRVLIEPQVDFYNYGNVPDGDYYALCRPVEACGKVCWECMNFVEANERRETYSNLLFL